MLKFETEQSRLSQKIRQERLNQGLTTTEVAYRCDFERSSYCRIESGRTNLTLRSICKICNALEIEITDLFARQ